MYLLLLKYAFVILAIISAAFFCLSVWNGRLKKRGRRYPSSAPVLSLVVEVMTQGVDHVADYFAKKSLQLGPMFTVAFGSRLCLILNTKEVIEAALLKQTLAYAGRESFYTEKLFNKKQKGLVEKPFPSNLVMHEKIITAKHMAAYGIIMRKFDEHYKRYHFLYMSILKEFGFGKHSLLESGISVEVKAMLDYLNTENGQTFNPRDLTVRMASNVISSILFGRRCNLNEDPSEAVRTAIWMVENMDAVLDVVPILRFTPSRRRLLQQLAKANDHLVASMKDEIRKSLELDAPASFVSRVVDKEGPEYDEEQMVITLRELIAAGSETMIASLLWSYVLLANNPSVQKRMQRELDEVIPNGSLPTLDDQPRLPFVEATIMEIMRRATVASISAPRITLKDTELCGYHIPSGTVVLPNLQAAHLDPTLWNDPEDFKPERFLDSENRVVKGRIIPFSVGRRSCLGEELARHEFFLFISGLVQHFTIKPPDGQRKIEVSKSGTIITSPSQFELRMIPRQIPSTRN